MGASLRDWATRPTDQAPAGLGDTASVPSAGDVFVIVYPFVRGVFREFGCDDVQTWTPGIRNEAVGPEDTGTVADAEGLARFTVEGVFRPGKFPTRVFYTRTFVDPDGKEFGKRKLLISTLGNFRARTRGYRIAYGVGEPLWPRTTMRTIRRTLEGALAGLRGEQ